MKRFAFAFTFNDLHRLINRSIFVYSIKILPCLETFATNAHSKFQKKKKKLHANHAIVTVSNQREWKQNKSNFTYMIVMMVIVVIVSAIIAAQTMWQMINVHVTAWMTVTGKCTAWHGHQTQCDLVKNQHKNIYSVLIRSSISNWNFQCKN